MFVYIAEPLVVLAVALVAVGIMSAPILTVLIVGVLIAVKVGLGWHKRRKDREYREAVTALSQRGERSNVP